MQSAKYLNLESLDTKVANGTLTLVLSDNSMHNTTIAGDGYNYQVTTPGSEWSTSRITSIYRCGKGTKDLVGEIHWRCFRSVKVRLGGEKAAQRWLPAKEFLRREGGSIFSQ